MSERFFVYILTGRNRGTLYVGVTNSLSRRVGEHKAGYVPGFTRTYKVTRLVYVEEYGSPLAPCVSAVRGSAISRMRSAIGRGVVVTTCRGRSPRRSPNCSILKVASA